MTPPELAMIARAHAERHRLDHNNRAWLAWNTAALGRQKEMARLRDLQIADHRHRPSEQEELAAVEAWAAVMKGR